MRPTQNSVVTAMLGALLVLSCASRPAAGSPEAAVRGAL